MTLWRRVLAALAVGLGALLGFIPYAAHAATGAPHAATGAPSPAAAPVVVVGTGGLTWSDVSQQGTPNLWRFVAEGATGQMTIRSVYTNACPVDGWLGFGSGTRAAGPPVDGSATRSTSDPCPAISPVVNGRVQQWNAYERAASGTRFDVHLGLIGDQARQAGVCVEAVGPGAALAAARSDGAVPDLARLSFPTDQSALEGGELTALLARCPLAIVDLGALRDPADLPAGEPAAGTRAQQVADLDRRLGAVLAQAPAGARILLGSLSDAGVTERLRLAAALGPGFAAGMLHSPSTRQPGLVQIQDLTVTTLSLAGLAVPAGLGGAVLTGEPDGRTPTQRAAYLADVDEESYQGHELVPPFFNGLVYAQIAIYLLVLLLWQGRIGGRATRLRSLRLVRDVAVFAAAVPVATFLANLVPWWRASHPLPAVMATVGVIAAAIAGVGLVGPWRKSLFGPVAVVLVTTVGVLAADVVTGSRLQLFSLMGLQPVAGGRYYGMGNVTFSLFATSTLLVATIAANRFVLRGRTRLAALAVGFIGGAAIVVDGAPFWGADGGGPPALLPAVVYLVLAILGVRLTWRRVLLIGAATAALFLLVAFLDWLRGPGSRSHLGGFFQSLLDGSAGDVILRKAGINLSILFGNYRLTLLVPIALLFVMYVLARPTSWGAQSLRRSFAAAPVLRPGLIAVVLMLTIGFAVNDSGVAIPAVGATILIPFVISTSVRTLEDDVREVDPRADDVREE